MVSEESKTIEIKRAIVNGLNIRYIRNFLGRVPEDKPVLVFLHGWGASGESFREVLSYCGEAIALDLPGFGGSEQPKGAWSLDEYVIFLRCFLEKMGIKNIILVGHSFGGSIAIRYAAEQKGIKRLILIGSAGIRQKNALRKMLWFGVAKSFGWVLKLPFVSMFRQRIRKQLYDRIGGEDYFESGTMRVIYQKIIHQDIQKDASILEIPVTLIWGENDIGTPLEDARRFQLLFQNSHLEVILQAGHYAFLDQPSRFREVFLTALL
jgi:pimeloyl-ACP methyl ester carboxylesterase